MTYTLQQLLTKKQKVLDLELLDFILFIRAVVIFPFKTKTRRFDGVTV